jgi:purine nucleosidase
VPVFSGAGKPLTRELVLADWFHGKDGLGDHGYKPAYRTAESEPAVDAIIRMAKANPGIELVTLGPLTNIAQALARDPTIVKDISRCVIMGGNPVCEGNVTPAAEFNIYVDPEAARSVFHSGLAIEMVGWQLCRGEAVFHAQDIAALRALKTPLADFAVECNSTAMEALKMQTGELGISLPDPTAMGILLQPELCLASGNHYVEIETVSEITRGMTVVDLLNVSGDARNASIWAGVRKVHICWRLDVPAWKRLVIQSLG